MLTTAGLLLQLLSPASQTHETLLRDARSAQVRFESVRRMHLPRDWSRSAGGSGVCDARIGRYCYWYDSTESPPIAEPREIGDARAKLLAVLDSAAARHPEDAWLAGQRTRYLIEAGRPDAAASAAHACRAERWWCAALEGMALHVAEQYAAADSIYAVALGAMSVAQRCEWLDLRLLVSDRLRHELDRASCDERATLAERLWSLSQPLWSTRGNDLRTEHFARLTMATILARSANTHGMAWGDDSRELLLRYGWAEWYTRYESGSGVYFSPTITGHDREPSYFFFPDTRSIRSIPTLAPDAWSLRNPIARTRYAPRHVKGLSGLTHVVARFPRRDSMLVAVAFQLRDTALEHDSINVYLATYRRAELRIGEARDGGGALWIMVPNDTMIASIEVRGATTKRAERARYTVDPLPRHDGWSLSDLLLFDPSRGYSGGDAERALPVAVVDLRFSARSAVGVLWEIESPSTAQAVWMGLTVEPLRVGFARRVATRLHLARELAPVRLRWQSVVQRSHEGQSVSLRLPPTARGRYRVILTVEPPGGPSLSSSRQIEVDR